MAHGEATTSAIIRAVKRRVMYVELKTGYADNGPASIGWVTFSKSGGSIYYRGRTLQRGNVVSGNYYDVDTREEFWVSGVKKNRQDRHWAGSSAVEIEPDAVDEYQRIIGA